MFRRSVAVAISLSLGSILTVGCAATDSEDTDSAEGAQTPANVTNTDVQRKLCVDRVAENGALRQSDLDHGAIRWKCGDVKGVTAPDLGQEYCEFHAVQEGGIVDRVAKSKVKPAKVECLFTSVYADTANGDEAKRGAELNTALTEEPGNLTDAKGKTLPSAGSNPLSIMNVGFNSRSAATALIRDCAAAAKKSANSSRVNKADDKQTCAGEKCSSARDVEACSLTIEASPAGWRNSDPVICGRAARGALCGTTYSPLPDALEGFIMTDWNQDLGKAAKYWAGKTSEAPAAPEGCRYATVNGKPYVHMMICDPPESIVTNPKYEGNLQLMCSEVFGGKIAMTAPIGLVSKTASSDDAFCKDFNKGASAIQGAVK